MFDSDKDNFASCGEIDIEADEARLDTVIGFVEEKLDNVGCSLKNRMQIAVAVEEVFVNIAKYAYEPLRGRAVIKAAVSDNPPSLAITFIDKGKPYNPLAKKDPDVTLPAEMRPIGGLGIYMVKKTMDDVVYEYRDGMNILTLVKYF